MALASDLALNAKNRLRVCFSSTQPCKPPHVYVSVRGSQETTGRQNKG